MALFSSTIPNMINGVSQQPYILRLSSQCDELVNGYATVSEGLKKRPASVFVAKLFDKAIDDAFIHVVNRDENEQYIVTISEGDIRIHDIKGNPYKVNFPDGLGYLMTSNPSTAFRAVTIADFTFLVNTEIKVQKGTKQSNLRPNEALVNVKQGNYGKTYKLFINGNLLSTFTTPDGSSASHSTQIDTVYIAKKLVEGVGQPAAVYYNIANTQTPHVSSVDSSTGTPIPSFDYTDITLVPPYDVLSLQFLIGTTVVIPQKVDTDKYRITYAETTVPPTITARYSVQPANPNGLQVIRYGSTLHVSAPDDFAISVEDGYNGNAMLAIKGKAQRFSDLPNLAPSDFTIEVTGDPSSSFDNYYVKYVKNNLADSYGVWTETVKSGIDVEILASTLPHVLVRESDGSFTFRTASWLERQVGDDDSSPFPSFVNNKVSDLFFYRNRLGILSDENVIFSEAGNFFNFFPTTVTAILDSDPIDVGVSHVKVSLLRHAVPFNEELLLFSAQTQFAVQSGDTLTPSSININQTTEFECSIKTRPVGAGRNVFFCVNKGKYTGVREYYVDGTTKTNDAAEVTGHVPRYIPSNVIKMAAASNEDMLALLSADDRSSLYVYRYYWSGDEKLQSSWVKWKFSDSDRLLSFEFIETKMYVVVAREDGTYLEEMSIELGATDDDIDLPYRVMLDRKVSVQLGDTFLFNGRYYTEVSLPYKLSANDKYVTVGADENNLGLISDIQVVNDKQCITGRYPYMWVRAGRCYEFLYRFSPQSIKQNATGGGSESVIQGRLQLRRFSITYEDSGYFKAVVKPRGNKTFEYPFTGRILGDIDNRLGVAALSTGVFNFPVMARNTEVDIDIVNDSPLPVTLLSASWEGFYVSQTQRI